MATVSALNYYPVKSLGGIALDAARVGPRGIEGDRQFMVVDDRGHFLTQRELPRLALVRPLVSAAGALVLRAPGMGDLAIRPTDDGPRTQVALWRDVCLAVDQGGAAAGWLTVFLRHFVRLVRMADEFHRLVNPAFAPRPSDEVGFADGYPLLLISEESLADLNRRLPEPVPMNRFRPNLVVRGVEPYAEDRWRRIRVGEVVFDVVKPCARCAIPTTDQDTAERGKEPLATLATYRRAATGAVMFGQNLVHAGPGTIRVGQPVEILEAANSPNFEALPASSLD